MQKIFSSSTPELTQRPLPGRRHGLRVTVLTLDSVLPLTNRFPRINHLGTRETNKLLVDRCDILTPLLFPIPPSQPTSRSSKVPCSPGLIVGQGTYQTNPSLSWDPLNSEWGERGRHVLVKLWGMRSRAQETLKGCSSENRKPPFQQREARIRTSRWGGICVPGSRRTQGTSILYGAWSHPFLRQVTSDILKVFWYNLTVCWNVFPLLQTRTKCMFFVLIFILASMSWAWSWSGLRTMAVQ